LAGEIVARTAAGSYDDRQATFPTGVESFDEARIRFADKFVRTISDGDDERRRTIRVWRYAEGHARRDSVDRPGHWAGRDGLGRLDDREWRYAD